MNVKLNPEVKARWVAALRSGEYQQGKGRLRNVSNEFCCLGVLCNLHAQAHPRIAAEELYQDGYLGCTSLPCNTVLKWADLDVDAMVTINGARAALYEHNDRGRTFAEIADAIEAQL